LKRGKNGQTIFYVTTYGMKTENNYRKFKIGTQREPF